ncbi:MAG: hypothetical protein AAFV19_14860 [Pseudomonadota bacterium]
MRDDDRDIAELDRLLGGTTAAYRALRHQGALPVGQPHDSRRWHIGRYAVAATVLIAVVGAAAVIAPQFLRSGDHPYRFAMPSHVTAPLSLRPNIKSRPALSGNRSRMAIRSRLPSRPAKGQG